MASSVRYRRATASLGSGVSSLYTMKGKCKPINRTAQTAWLKLHGYNPNLIVSLSSGARTFAKADVRKSEAKPKRRKAEALVDFSA